MDASAMEVRDIEGTLVSLIDLGQITAADVSARSVEFAQLYRVAHVAAARLSGRAVVHDERNYRKIGSSLVPAYDFMLEYRPGAVVVQARSSGESIVYLPFQFSNCLQLTQQGEPRAELLRVNGAQAALYFVKNAAARISNALTYFGDSSCRRRDFMDVFRLGVWPEDSFDELVKGRRVPFLMQMYLNARLRLRDRILLENRSKPR